MGIIRFRFHIPFSHVNIRGLLNRNTNWPTVASTLEINFWQFFWTPRTYDEASDRKGERRKRDRRDLTHFTIISWEPGREIK